MEHFIDDLNESGPGEEEMTDDYYTDPMVGG